MASRSTTDDAAILRREENRRRSRMSQKELLRVIEKEHRSRVDAGTDFRPNLSRLDEVPRYYDEIEALEGWIAALLSLSPRGIDLQRCLDCVGPVRRNGPSGQTMRVRESHTSGRDRFPYHAMDVVVTVGSAIERTGWEKVRLIIWRDVFCRKTIEISDEVGLSAPKINGHLRQARPAFRRALAGVIPYTCADREENQLNETRGSPMDHEKDMQVATSSTLDENLLDVKQVAEYLMLNEATIRRKCKEGFFPGAFIMDNNRWRIPERSIRTYIQECKRQQAGPVSVELPRRKTGT